MPTALITGIRGQDGAYLSKRLIDKGYTVWGAIRVPGFEPRSAKESNVFGEHQVDSWALKALGISDYIRYVGVSYLHDDSLMRAIEIASPDEVYNLAAQSSVARSFEVPTETGEITALGVTRLLHAIHKVSPKTRFYQASSSEMFGIARESPQTENTPFHPRSPYGVAKVYAHHMTVNYREAFGLYACNGILFNHESPLRGEQFVTRKICSAVARIKMGLQSELKLGNVDVERDWGFAGDYVEAMHLMLQQDKANDYIIATGKTHSLREFVALAFRAVDLDYRDWVKSDPTLYRPAEVSAVVGDSRLAQQRLGWKPRVSFEQLVAFLVEAEMKRVEGQEQSVSYFPAHL